MLWPHISALWENRGTEKVETLKNQGQHSFPPNVMKFGEQVGYTYAKAQPMPFGCQQFPSMDLYTFPITSKPEVRPQQLSLRSQHLSITNLMVPSGTSVFCFVGTYKILQDSKCCRMY